MNVTRNAAWLLGCRISGDFLNLLLFVLISRVFGPAGVGEYAYCFAVVGFIWVIGNLGIDDYGLREYMRIEPSNRSRFIAELLGTQVVMVGATVAGTVVYLLFTKPSAAMLGSMGSIAFYQACLALSTALFIPAMSQQFMMGRALVDLTCRGAAFVYAGAAIYIWHASIPQALLGYLLAGVLLMAFSRASAERLGCTVRIWISGNALRATVGVLWSFAAVEVLGQLFTRVGVIVLTLKASEAAAGLYATGLRVIEVGLMPLAFMGLAAYPQLSRLFVEDRAAFQRSARDFIWGVLVAGIVLAWGLYFVAPALLVPVLGNKYAGSQPVMQAMAALAVIQAVEVGIGRVLFAAHQQVARALAIFLGAAAALALNLALVPRFSVNGAIAAGVLSFGVINVVYLGAMRRAMTGRSLPQALIGPLAGLALAAFAVRECAGQGFAIWVQALLSAVAFCVVAGGGFWLSRGWPMGAARSE